MGCELSAKEVFYSSGADTGVPSGADLLAHVREQAQNTKLVIAIISPTYQTRPVCMAELGAAWGAVGRLFPLLTPGMDRSELQGVLSPMLIRYMDDQTALDELHDEVGNAIGHTSSALTWGRSSQKWLASVARRAKTIPVPEVVTAKQWKETQDQLANALASLDARAAQVEELTEKVRELKDARTAEDVARILLPEGEKDRFEALTDGARLALREVGSPVAEVIRYDVALAEYDVPMDLSKRKTWEPCSSEWADYLPTSEAANRHVPGAQIL